MSAVTLDFEATDNLTQRHLEDYFTALNNEVTDANNLFVIRRAAVTAAASAGWFESTAVNYINGKSEGSVQLGDVDGDLVGGDIKAVQALGKWVMDTAREYNDVDPN